MISKSQHRRFQSKSRHHWAFKIVVFLMFHTWEPQHKNVFYVCIMSQRIFVHHRITFMGNSRNRLLFYFIWGVGHWIIRHIMPSNCYYFLHYYIQLYTYICMYIHYSDTKKYISAWCLSQFCITCMTVEWNWSWLLNGKSKDILVEQDKTQLLISWDFLLK